MNLSACLEGKEMNGTRKENKTDIEKTREGNEMALTSSDLQAIQGLLQPINERLDGIDNRLDRVESEASSLKSGQLEIRKELREVNRKVSDTYDLALEAWGKSTENRR